MARTTGLGAASLELLRPTAPAEPPAEPPAPPDDGTAEEHEEGGAAPPPPTATRARRKRPAPAGRVKPRNLRLTEDVHDRLWLLARQRKQSISAVANGLLDQVLPRWELKRQG